MTPLCRICNHEHGVAAPHEFGASMFVKLVHTPDKGTVYVSPQEDTPPRKHVPRRKAKSRKKAKTRVARVAVRQENQQQGSSDANQDLATYLANERRKRAEYMRKYRADVKARVQKD